MYILLLHRLLKICFSFSIIYSSNLRNVIQNMIIIIESHPKQPSCSCIHFLPHSTMHTVFVYQNYTITHTNNLSLIFQMIFLTIHLKMYSIIYNLIHYFLVNFRNFKCRYRLYVAGYGEYFFNLILFPIRQNRLNLNDFKSFQSLNFLFSNKIC